MTKENSMYLGKVAYQLGVRVKSLVPCFHKSHLQNPALLVIGIAYSEIVSLPKAARSRAFQADSDRIARREIRTAAAMREADPARRPQAGGQESS
jgi:hypothetical protein